MRIIVTSETNEAFKPVSDITFPVIQEYCDRHGYEFRPKVVNDPVRSVVWDRCIHLQDALAVEGVDWAVHVDADWMPTKMSVRFEDVLDGVNSVVLSWAKTESGDLVFNDGFLAVRDSIFGHGILACCWKSLNLPDKKIFCLQDALQHVYDNANRDVKNHFSIVPQVWVNSFDYREYKMPETTFGQWHEGDFAIHLPGLSNKRRVEVLTEYKERILR